MCTGIPSIRMRRLHYPMLLRYSLTDILMTNGVIFMILLISNVLYLDTQFVQDVRCRVFHSFFGRLLLFFLIPPWICPQSCSPLLQTLIINTGDPDKHRA